MGAALRVDFSHWQPEFPVDVLESWRDAGAGRPILKLGGANDGTYHSAYHRVMVPRCREVWGAVDHYWFNGRASSFEAQADVVAEVGILPGERFVHDVENEGSLRRWSAGEVVQMATALEARGIPFEDQDVYMSASVTAEEDWRPVIELGLRAWVAMYHGLDNRPLVHWWPTCRLWQFTSQGRMPGYLGNLDLNQVGPVWTVHGLQDALNRTIGTGLVVDGIYGPATWTAVRGYQAGRSLTVDGDAGRITLRALEAELGRIWEVSS